MVAIKGIEMPTNCSSCALNYECCCCTITGTRFLDDELPEGFDEFEARLPDCPLVEVEMEE